MVTKRSALVGGLAVLVCAALPFGVSAAPVDGWLDTAFKALPEEGRRVVQSVLARSDLYAGVLDGVWSPDVSAALAAFPAHITAASSDGVSVVLEDQGDALRFLREVSEGLWEPILFGGLGENAFHNTP